MAANRLFLLFHLLLKNGTMTAPELAGHFEVSVRTIYRDIDILSAAGIPIYTTQGKGGGISIPQNYILNRSMITDQEQNQILMALQSLSIIDSDSTDSILSKLNNIFRKQSFHWIEIDYSDWNRNSDVNFNLLKDAIFQGKKISFLYYSVKGKPSSRLAEPLKLVFKDSHWFLYAFCCFRNDYRLFKLTRIKDLRITDEHFARTAPTRVFEQLNPHQEQTIKIILRFDKESACRIYDHFDTVKEMDDGNFLVEAEIPDNEWLYSFILSFGFHAEVISPQEVRKEVAARINKMLENYTAPGIP